jgi:carboxyl-terminal processing protease
LGKDNADGRVFVRDAPPDMGAAKAGIRVGDEVLAVDGAPVGPMSPEGIHSAVAGAVGSKVRVTVRRRDQTLTIVVERGPLQGT